MLRKFHLVVSCFMVVWLTACATPNLMENNSLTAGVFKRTGRFSVSTEEAGGGQEAVQGGFAWTDTQQYLTLNLSNPMGTTLAQVQVYDNYSMLQHSNGTTETASTPDALIMQTLGLPIPVANLRYWIQGKTGSGRVTGLRTNNNSHISEFNQHGWRVSLSRYDEYGPKLIQLNRHDHQRRISVRLAITQ